MRSVLLSGELRGPCARVAFALIVGSWLVSSSAPGQIPFYRVNLGAVPKNGTEADNTFKNRADAVIQAAACGRELEFFKVADTRDPEGLQNGDPYPVLIAKARFLAQHLRGASCVADVPYGDRDGETAAHVPVWKEPFAGKRWEEPVGPVTRQFILGSINRVFTDRYGPDCGDAATDIVSPASPSEPRRIRFELKQKCLRRQVRTELMRREQTGRPGTNSLPCYGVGKAPKGDWDMAVYNLTRLYYVGRQDPLLFDDATYAKLQNNLLTISGWLELDSYPAGGCEYPQNTTGSAEERANEVDFYDEGFFEDLGDILDWLLPFLVIAAVIAAALIVPIVLGAGAAPLGAIAAAVAAAIATSVAVNQIRIEETENHLLMINSSKYLKNRMIIDDLKDPDQRQIFLDFNSELKDWLLDRFQKILEEDFIEYNSRPYQRLSLGAIKNIFDFSEDTQLEDAAGAVLDFAAAKMALASSQGRRIVPFRRKAGANSLSAAGQSMFEVGNLADHQIAAMMLWSGQTQHSENRLVSLGAGAEMVEEATSSYRPHPLILDIAIDKSTPYEQTIHHDGWEIYSSGNGWLLTAGGNSTFFANLASWLGIRFPAPGYFKMKNEDRGAGVPTTLMPLSASSRQHRYADFLRFEGIVKEWPKDNPDDPEEAPPMTYDGNLCVRQGFACGLRPTVPPPIESCLQASSVAGLNFLDSKACPPYKDASRFFVVLFRGFCHPSYEECGENGRWGFLEVIDVEDDRDFQAFKTETIQQNIGRFAFMQTAASAGGIARLTYLSRRGEFIHFIPGSEDLAIVEIGARPPPTVSGLADGDILQADGDGEVTIKRPNDPRRIELDLRDAENPKRVLPP
jgi:hypothetical protein